MKEDNKNKINRRDFFKLAGAGTLASAAALYGCSGNKNNGESESAALGEIPTGKMTYRTNPNTGDRVSLLGYGCMRWPTRKRADGNGDEIDQEAVNDLIDYAIAHGVNYFDTSPAYVQGLSERATGIALKRHPREKFFLATKLSNSPRLHRPHILLLYRSGCGRNGSRSRTPGICRKSAGARLASRLSALPWTIPARVSSRSVPTGFSGGGTSPSPSSIG